MVGMADPAERKSVATVDRDHELGWATWTEVAAAPSGVVLVPVGSCEQHGPHLPLDTDTRIAVEVSRQVAETDRHVVVAPPVAYGASGEHQAFPGTLSIGAEALTTVLVELGRSAFPDPADRLHRALVFVNGHGGNVFAVRRAVEVLIGEGRPASAWAPSVPDGDAHAGRTETSLLLAITPDAVGDDRPRGATAPLADLLEPMRAGGVAAVSANGVLGDAAGASADEGRVLLAALVDDLRAHVDAVAAAP
jgi:mycofactocin system creatininase family protein